MLFKRIISEGLAHYSYLLGEGKTALVIDPRRDCQVYIDEAHAAGMRIAHILETHRNEDYVIGSTELAARTGAQIWHADGELDYAYGQPAQEGQTWNLGGYTLEALATPGHTPGSMSYLLHDVEGFPWMVFTGDTLFAGDVGRVDLPGLELMDEMANAQYDSVFNKLLPLGDEVIICPGHGAGSVCGAGIVDRAWTTLGIERQHNPKLQHTSREAFVQAMAVALERPPYFRKMEALNLSGAPMPALPSPRPLAPAEFAQAARDAQVLDVRLEYSFGSVLVPGAFSIWLGGVPGFAGWFLSYDKPLLLVAEENQVEDIVHKLVRMGYDNVAGFLSGGMHDWVAAGLDCDTISTVTVQQLCHLLDAEDDPWILDVRSDKELAAFRIPAAHHIHLTELPQRMGEVPQDRPVYLFCGSGQRSMTAASLLKRAGWAKIHVVLGGMSGWRSISCPLE